MNDRYVFRGKRTSNGEWVEGLLGRYNADYECANIIDEFECLVPVKTKTVGQYTGLKDKNGKRIFEGDIVEYNNEIFVIKWIEGFAAYGMRSPRNMRQAPAITPITVCNFSVIGNIHDNPELLKGE